MDLCKNCLKPHSDHIIARPNATLCPTSIFSPINPLRQDLYDKTAENVLNKLKGRRGFRHLIESIELEDKELYKEIADEISDELRKVF